VEVPITPAKPVTEDNTLEVVWGIGILLQFMVVGFYATSVFQNATPEIVKPLDETDIFIEDTVRLIRSRRNRYTTNV